MKQLPQRLKQLAPFVVEALPTFKRYKTRHVLDLGCGAGRHSVYLAKNRFHVVGVDVSRSALRLARKWTQDEGLKNVTYVQSAMECIPFCDRQFDAVISVSVIHHARKKDIEKTIGEVHRILTENGMFLANLASVNDPRYGQGEKVEPRTFRTLEGFAEKRFEELHHYSTKQEAVDLLARFTEATVEPLKGPPNYWKITAFK